MRLALLLLTACAEAPAPLPPPLGTPAPVEARRVRVPGLEGMVVRPAVPGEERAVLLVAEAIDASARAEAEALGRQGRVVLVVDAAADLDRARAYLEGMAGVRPPAALRCLRSVPCVSTGG